MQQSDIKKFILSLANMPDDEIDFFVDNLQTVDLKRDDFFLSPGDPANKIAFVSSGVFKSYRINKEGNEFVDAFLKTGDLIGDDSSLEKENASTCYIQALTDAKVFVSSENISETLHARNPLWYSVGLKIIKKINFHYKRRVEQLTMLKTVDRYHSFCQTHEAIINVIAQKDIASYLGVTPESLSRILKDQSRKQN